MNASKLMLFSVLLCLLGAGVSIADVILKTHNVGIGATLALIGVAGVFAGKAIWGIEKRIEKIEQFASGSTEKVPAERQ